MALLISTGCADRHEVSGVVVDRASHMPMDSVAITGLDVDRKEGYEWTTSYTGPDGRFTLSLTANEIREKSRVPFIFQKQAYGSITQFFPLDEKKDTFYLEKLKNP